MHYLSTPGETGSGEDLQEILDVLHAPAVLEGVHGNRVLEGVRGDARRQLRRARVLLEELPDSDGAR